MDAALKHFIRSSCENREGVLQLIAETLMADDEEGTLLDELQMLYANNQMDHTKDTMYERLEWLCEWYKEDFLTYSDAE